VSTKVRTMEGEQDCCKSLKKPRLASGGRQKFYLKISKQSQEVQYVAHKEDMTIVYIFLVIKPEGKRMLLRFKCRCENIS